jgi:hypothetical protein
MWWRGLLCYSPPALSRFLLFPENSLTWSSNSRSSSSGRCPDFQRVQAPGPVLPCGSLHRSQRRRRVRAFRMAPRRPGSSSTSAVGVWSQSFGQQVAQTQGHGALDHGLPRRLNVAHSPSAPSKGSWMDGEPSTNRTGVCSCQYRVDQSSASRHCPAECSAYDQAAARAANTAIIRPAKASSAIGFW